MRQRTRSYGRKPEIRMPKVEKKTGSRVGCRGKVPHRSTLVTLHFSKAKMRFQSFFMLMTVQAFFFACAISASVNVPTLDFGP